MKLGLWKVLKWCNHILLIVSLSASKQNLHLQGNSSSISAIGLLTLSVFYVLGFRWCLVVLFNVLHSVFLKVVSSLSSQHTINFPFFLILHEGKKGRHKAKHVALKNILYSAIMTLWVQLTFGNLFIFIDRIYQIYNQYS